MNRMNQFLCQFLTLMKERERFKWKYETELISANRRKLLKHKNHWLPNHLQKQIRRWRRHRTLKSSAAGKRILPTKIWIFIQLLKTSLIKKVEKADCIKKNEIRHWKPLHSPLELEADLAKKSYVGGHVENTNFRYYELDISWHLTWHLIYSLKLHRNIFSWILVLVQGLSFTTVDGIKESINESWKQIYHNEIENYISLPKPISSVK